LAQAPSGDYREPIELECAQVPKEFQVGSPIWLWLGSDNKKGKPTDWTQGIRALARCAGKTALGGGKFHLILDEVFILPRTIEKFELLQTSPETYAQSLSDTAIVGLNNYSAQVVHILSPEEFSTITAIVARLLPEVRGALFSQVPGAEAVELFPRQQPAVAASGEAEPGATWDPQEGSPGELTDDDPILREVVRLVIDDGMGGALSELQEEKALGLDMGKDVDLAPGNDLRQIDLNGASRLQRQH